MKKNLITLLALLSFLLSGEILVAQQARAPFDIEKPEMRVFLPSPQVATGKVVVACPGGGYQNLAYEHEGYDWAPCFNSQGIALVVLKYRMPGGKNPDRPVSDAGAALKMVRDSAGAWNINPYDVGIMGFSAGGHLAALMATGICSEVQPDFQILFYPVITMDKSYTHLGSRNSLLGAEPTADLKKQYSCEKRVNACTPRAFIVFSDDDKGVSPVNGADYYLALQQKGIPASFHVYPSGGHGWGFRETFPYHNEMLGELTAWLKSWKPRPANAVRVACIGNSITYGAGIRNREADSYPAVLGRLLGDGYWVRNFGYSSRTILNKGDHPYMKEQMFRDALGFNPGIVVIKLGTNDSKPENWKYGGDFSKDMQAMIDAFLSLPVRPVVYLCYPPKAYRVQYGIDDNVIVKEIIPKLKKLAQKNKLRVIDLHTATDGMPGFFPDAIHPNEKGAEVIAGTVFQAIK